jgi:CheY-like chemotaxis protein
MMPRMTGIELTRRARELQPSISCFVITGIERPALAEADLVTWLTKPIDVDAVVASLRCTLSLCP